MKKAGERRTGVPKDMVPIPAGEFLMGSTDFYPEERPVHRESVDAFVIDEHPVTVAEFRRFVRATDYATMAERPIDPDAYRTPIRTFWPPVHLCST